MLWGRGVWGPLLASPLGAVLVCTKPALASKTPVFSSGATVAYARRCSSIAFQVAFALK